jgi:hypothetical protein
MCAVRALLCRFIVKRSRLRLALNRTTSQFQARLDCDTCNSLQKSIALTPLAPKAGPTGGDGVALPAGTKIFYTSEEEESVSLCKSWGQQGDLTATSIATYHDLCHCYFRHDDRFRGVGYIRGLDLPSTYHIHGRPCLNFMNDRSALTPKSSRRQPRT